MTSCCEVEAAVERLGGDVELYKDLVDRFLNDVSGTRHLLENAVAQRDAAAIHSAAHSLKGLAGSCGATAVMAALAELESLGRGSELGRLSELWPRFQGEMERAAEELAPYCRQSEPQPAIRPAIVH